MKVIRTIEVRPCEYETVTLFEGTETECTEYEIRCYENGMSGVAID